MSKTFSFGALPTSAELDRIFRSPGAPPPPPLHNVLARSLEDAARIAESHGIKNAVHDVVPLHGIPIQPCDYVPVDELWLMVDERCVAILKLRKDPDQ